MKDATIIRMLDEARKGLEGVEFPAKTPHLLPSYKALLAAATANHPSDPYLQALGTINDRESDRDCGPEEMRILFGQLSIFLESFLEQPRG